MSGLDTNVVEPWYDESRADERTAAIAWMQRLRDNIARARLTPAKQFSISMDIDDFDAVLRGLERMRDGSTQ